MFACWFKLSLQRIGIQDWHSFHRYAACSAYLEVRAWPIILKLIFLQHQRFTVPVHKFVQSKSFRQFKCVLFKKRNKLRYVIKQLQQAVNRPVVVHRSHCIHRLTSLISRVVVVKSQFIRARRILIIFL